MSSPRVIVSSAFALLALLAACSETTSVSVPDTLDSLGTPASTTTMPDTTSSSSTSGATSVPVTLPITTMPIPECANTATPSGEAVALVSASGDWDGDGSEDSALSWGEPTAAGAAWFVRLDVDGGAASTIALGDLGVGYAEVLDRVDVDFSLGAEPGVNRDELLAIVGSNAAGYDLGVFGLDEAGCAVQFDNGAAAPYVIPIHAAVTTMSGLTCDGGGGSQFLVRLTAATTDGVNWATTAIRIERPGPQTLVDGASVPGVMTAADPSLVRYSQAACGDTIWIGGPADE